MNSHLSIFSLVAATLVVLMSATCAQYSPYSPHPMANARSTSSFRRNGNTYNRAQEFRAAENGRQRYGGSYGSSDFTSFNGQSSYNGETNGINGAALSYDNGGSQQYGTNGQSASIESSNGQLVANGYGSSSSDQYSEDLAQPSANDPDGDSIIGEAGRDYPTLVQPVATSFQCSSQQLPGLYADTDSQCQMFHICQQDGRQDSFVCPVGSIFNQKYFVCDWWYNVNCADAPSFYHLNAQLYQEPERYASVPAYASSYATNSDSAQLFNGQMPQFTNGEIGYQNGATSGHLSSNGYRNGATFGHLSSNGYQNGVASGHLSSNGYQNGATSGHLSSNGYQNGFATGHLSSNGYRNGATSGHLSSNGYQNGAASGRLSGNGYFNGAASGRLFSNGYQNGASSGNLMTNGFQNGAISSNGYKNGAATGRLSSNGYGNGATSSRLSSNGYQNGGSSSRLLGNGYQNGATSSRLAGNGYQNGAVSAHFDDNGSNGGYPRADTQATGTGSTGY